MENKNLRSELTSLINKGIITKGEKCCCCEERENLHLHHIIPLSLGGTNEQSNLTTVCGYHHSILHNMNSLMKMDYKENGERIKKDFIVIDKINGVEYKVKGYEGVSEVLNKLIKENEGWKWGRKTVDVIKENLVRNKVQNLRKTHPHKFVQKEEGELIEDFIYSGGVDLFIYFK